MYGMNSMEAEENNELITELRQYAMYMLRNELYCSNSYVYDPQRLLAFIDIEALRQLYSKD
jgi:hypothetical protein